jgi:hypothetical protein
VQLRTVLMLGVLAIPNASHAVHGRLSLDLLAGGGWASDVFVGADLGAGLMTQVIPSARLDLSLSPGWKLASFADFSYGHYVTSGFTSLAESASVQIRHLPGTSWDATLELEAEHAHYSLGSPLDPSGTGPSVFGTLGARVSPLWRLRSLGVEWRLAGVAAIRTSTAAGGDIAEQELAGLAGIMVPLGGDASLAVTYKLDRNDSARPDFTFTSHAAFALATWSLAELDWQAQLQLQTASYADGAGGQFGRLTLGVTCPVSPSLDVEASYSLAATRSDDPSRPSAARHLAFLALRWRFLEVGW